MQRFKHKEIVSSLLHLVAIFLSIAGLVILIVWATHYGTAWHVVTFSIFGSTMIFLYLASTIYHAVHREHHWKAALKVLDHSMIYVLIAGTYTPICLVALRGGWGWSMFGVIWGLALMGIGIKQIKLRMPPWVPALLYIGMGWIIIIAVWPLVHALSPLALWWLFMGGVCYTVGTAFFGMGRLFPKSGYWGYHEWWHVMVMAGSFAHWWLMLKYILYIPT